MSVESTIDSLKQTAQSVLNNLTEGVNNVTLSGSAEHSADGHTNGTANGHTNGVTNGHSKLSSWSDNPHPFDPLSPKEIETAVAVVKAAYPDANFIFNTVTVQEPRKAAMQSWLSSSVEKVKPPRVAEVVCIEKGNRVFDGLVDLNEKKVIAWEKLDGVQPIITMAELQLVENIVRTHPKVIEQCKIIGIAEEDMHKVYCDPWTIGYDERFGTTERLQQALMYYRPDIDDSQYTFPLDFCPIFNAETHEIIHIDIPAIRRPLSKAKPCNYTPKAVEEEFGGYYQGLKPLNITQPEGVSFEVSGREISWAKWRFHVGFNAREGIVLNNIRFDDRGTERSIFYRLSIAEMVVPYGNPEHPHQRKHAFDLGEYGGGNMSNSLSLGCDCKGAIRYLDYAFAAADGSVATIPNAVCIHEEDGGILFKHTDFRDDSVIVTRARKLVVSHVFTAANYEYCVYWIFHLDGTVQLEIKLTGILNTYSIDEGEETHGWGTRVYPGVNAHNHQHLFCLRVDPQVDGPNNTVFQVDAVRGPAPLGSPGNRHGNAFFAQKTPYRTPRESMADYDASTSRTWDISNPSKVNRHSGKPATYKLVSREVPPLLPAPGSLVWKRAGFARHAVHVTPYRDDQLAPAGRHVPQTSGAPSRGLPEWIERHGDESVEDADLVLWHTFGLTHFPAPEDYPLMPAEPMGLLLRPRNFFDRNPALDIRPSYCSTPSTVAKGLRPLVDARDQASKAV